MLLSNAIMMGSVAIDEVNPYSYCGCALAMGLLAAGKAPYELRRDVAERTWPWLINYFDIPEFSRSLVIPPLLTRASGTEIVSAMFFSVCEKRITLEHLVDWVKSVEPEEAEQYEPILCSNQKVCAQR
jgi:hypothetical protein